MNNTRDTKLLKAFGKHLRELREAKNMSQEQLAIDANTSISQIGRIERGEINTTISTLKILADSLGVSMAKLVSF